MCSKWLNRRWGTPASRERYDWRMIEQGTSETLLVGLLTTAMVSPMRKRWYSSSADWEKVKIPAEQMAFHDNRRNASTFEIAQDPLWQEVVKLLRAYTQPINDV